ncbi:MAG TPA: CPBP family intramembrane glutamic endopeptidase [Verrucomicrobiae bacterium]|nr:CPBP family intramembrane glutamic endopeptidase [Verrucomicrobiae bacterium]
MHWDFAVILIFFAVAVPLLGRRRIRQLLDSPGFSSLDRLRLYASTVAFQWFASGIILWRIHARSLPLSALGVALPHPALSIEVGAALSFLLLVNQLLGLRRLAKRPFEPRSVVPRLAAKIFPRTPRERLFYFAVVSTVAVCEEWIYRGFAQRVFQDAAGGMLLAGIAGSAVLFAFAHLYQGRRGVFTTGILGALFSVVRAWTGSLLPTIAAHFVADLTVGLLAPAKIAPDPAQIPEGAPEAAAGAGREENNITNTL